MPDNGLEEYLAKLRSDREMLDIRIAGVLEELGRDPSEAEATPSSAGKAVVGTTRGPVVTGKVRPDEFFRMKLGEAIKRYLEIMKQPQQPKAIVKALQDGGVLTQSKNFYVTVWTAIKRLRDAGDITNTPTGWAISSWYPNQPKFGASEKKPKKAKKHAKKTKKPKAPVAARQKPKRAGLYQAFVSEQMKAGKTLGEAAKAWHEKKGES